MIGDCTLVRHKCPVRILLVPITFILLSKASTPQHAHGILHIRASVLWSILGIISPIRARFQQWAISATVLDYLRFNSRLCPIFPCWSTYAWRSTDPWIQSEITDPVTRVKKRKESYWIKEYTLIQQFRSKTRTVWCIRVWSVFDNTWWCSLSSCKTLCIVQWWCLPINPWFCQDVLIWIPVAVIGQKAGTAAHRINTQQSWEDHT